MFISNLYKNENDFLQDACKRNEDKWYSNRALSKSIIIIFKVRSFRMQTETEITIHLFYIFKIR